MNYEHLYLEFEARKERKANLRYINSIIDCSNHVEIEFAHKLYDFY